MKIETGRRGFIGSLGAMAAVSALPAVADDSPPVFSERGDFERLVLAYQHIHIGLPRPFSVLHISDTHLTAAYPHEDEKKQQLKRVRTKTFGGRQEEALRDSLAWARKNVDYVIHTGDVIDWQSEANFDLVKKYFGPSVIGAIGNHEYSRYMWLEKEEQTSGYKARSTAILQKTHPFDIHFQSRTVNGVNFVSLDSVYGCVDSDQVERFHAEVGKGLPIILCVHVPFYTDDIWRCEQKYWQAGRKFANGSLPEPRGYYLKQKTDPTTRTFVEYLRKESLLKGILAGDLHITVQDRFSQTAMEYVVGGNFMFHGQEVLFT